MYVHNWSSDSEAADDIAQAVEKSKLVFETREGIRAEEVYSWIRGKEREYCNPMDEREVLSGRYIRAGPPPPGKRRFYFPRLPVREYIKPGTDELPRCPGAMESLIPFMRRLDKSAIKKFVAERVAVVRRSLNGDETVMFVPRSLKALKVGTPLHDPNAAPIVHQQLKEWEEDIQARKYTKTYLLSELFDNPEIAAQYNASPRTLKSLKLTGSGQPRHAAAIAQDLLNHKQGHTCVEVVLEHSGPDRLRAASMLRCMTKGYKPTSGAMDGAVIGNQVFYFGYEGEKDWHVRGPLERMELISRLFWMISCEGPYYPAMLLAAELSALDIHVSDGLLGSWDSTVYYHRGVTSECSGAVAHASEGLDGNVVAVEDAESIQIGSAVRVSNKYALVNAHLCEAAECVSLSGVPALPRTQLATDLLLVRSDSESSGINLRKAVVGENVAIVYSRGGELVSSPALTVMVANDNRLVLSPCADVGPGMSGGAVVAAVDDAVLGLHSGVNAEGNLLACTIDAGVLASRLSDAQDSASAVSTPDSYAYKVHFSYKSTGRLATLKSLFQSIVPIYVGEIMIANGVAVGREWYCPIDLPANATVGASREPLTIIREGYFTFGPTVKKAPMYVRTPNSFEEVSVLVGGSVSEHILGPVRVSGVGKVPYVAADVFTDSLAMVGACVFGSDGAAVGILGRMRSDLPVGLAFELLPYPKLADALAESDSVRVLEDVFPYLSLYKWPPNVVDEIVMHSSCGEYSSRECYFNAGPRPLANIGDDAAKMVLYQRLRASRVPYKEWSGIWQSRQSNAVLSQRCWDVGLAQCLKYASGISFPPDAKAYADMMEALFGAVSIYETPAVLAQVLEQCGAIPFED